MGKRERIAAALCIILLEEKKKKRSKRSCWVKKRWLEKRYHIDRPIITDSQQLENFMGMTAVEVQHIVDLVGPIIGKRDTVMRKAISVEERVLVTLKFLTSGRTYLSLQDIFNISSTTIGGIVDETSRAIYTALKDEYMKVPSKSEDWLKCSDDYNNQWRFPHCLGAVDARHVVISTPPKEGHLFYNYKGTFSMVLLAVVDANYKFTYAGVFSHGQIPNGDIFNSCGLQKAIESGVTKLPSATSLPGRTDAIPYFFVADDGFENGSYILKPFPGEDQPEPNLVFNYRLSKATGCVENALGIISNRFRILRKPLMLKPSTIENVVMAICSLHNFLCTVKRDEYLPIGSVDVSGNDSQAGRLGDWRTEGLSKYTLLPLQPTSRQSNHFCIRTRNELTNFFMTPED